MDPNQLNSFFNYLQNFSQIPNTQQSQTSNTQVPNQNFTLPNTFQNPNPQNLSNFNFQTPYNNQFPIFQPQNQNSQTPHFPFSSIFNPSIGNVTPTFLPFPTQFSASRRNSSGVGGSSNPSSQTPIQSSPNSQYSDFANPRGLDAIDLNDDDIEDRRQNSIQHWHWKEDEMLISAWLNVSTDPGVVACKKRWYKINKAVAQFAGCYDQASRNIRSGSNADDIKELAYKLYSTNYGKKFTFERHWNMLRLKQKWRSQLPTQSGGSKRTKVSATGAYSSSSNPETPLADEPVVDSPVRP
ncbi:glutathione S-transferase T2-like [Arachis stenosperma]|uniref:glutathione S-transferase T2-like n=1 Tax=Arachis stenosperma TaxID=217475 RepID=UPI0025AB680C|nr:glutathione S-transferase T2-like [Arachis stenosperma]